jgi:hypothetical protein
MGLINIQKDSFLLKLYNFFSFLGMIFFFGGFVYLNIKVFSETH